MATFVIQAQIDALELYSTMDKGKRRLVFGVVNAINDTMKEAQKAVEARVARVFIIRDRRLFFGEGSQRGHGQAAILTPFASVPQGRLFAELAVGHPQGSRNKTPGPFLFARFEEGAAREPFRGSHAVAFPITGRPARPAINRPVPPAFTIAGLKLREFVAGKRLIRGRARRGVGIHGEFGRLALPTPGAERIFKGLQRTFLLTRTAKEPLGGIFQRFGPGREDIRLLYAFRTGLRLDQRLHFVQTVTDSIHRWFPEFMERQKLDALAHAVPGAA